MSLKGNVLFILLQVSMSWNLSIGYIRLCQDNTVELPNGTKISASILNVSAEIDKPVSILLCVTPDRKIYNYVHITEPQNRLGFYNDNTTKGVYATFSRNENEKDYVVNITIKNVESRDLGVNFYVKICTEIVVRICENIHEFVIFRFVLQLQTKETESSSRPTITTITKRMASDKTGRNIPPENSSASISQEMMNYMYIAIAVLIVVIIAVITGVLIYRYRGRVIKSSRAPNAADELNAYAEIKDAMIDTNNEGHEKTDKIVARREARDGKRARGDNSEGPLISAAHEDDKDTGRNISEQGLVYVTVAQATKEDNKKSEQASDKKKKPQETKQEPVVESVEYTTVDFRKNV